MWEKIKYRFRFQIIIILIYKDNIFFESFEKNEKKINFYKKINESI